MIDRFFVLENQVRLILMSKLTRRNAIDNMAKSALDAIDRKKIKDLDIHR